MDTQSESIPFGTDEWFNQLFLIEDSLDAGVRERLQTISTSAKTYAKAVYSVLPKNHLSKAVVDEVFKTQLLAISAVVKNRVL